jgi:hypothetical protein
MKIKFNFNSCFLVGVSWCKSWRLLSIYLFPCCRVDIWFPPPKFKVK